MWRLKIADGGKDPYIFSTNNFVGRQTWEFDPNAGTAEDRAAVEEARRNFFNNRHKVKPSSDLLWRAQFLKEKEFRQTISGIKIEDGEDISYEKTTTTLKRSVQFFSALQASDGHWPAENSGALFFLPPLVTSQYGNSYHHAEHITLGQFAFVAAEAGDYMAFFFAPDHNPQITFSVDFDWKTSVVAKDWFNVAMKGSVDRKRPRKELNRGQS